MKKLPTLGLDKVLLVSGFTLALTMAGFWHHHQSVNMAEQLATFQQGVSTCFARVTQTFTAAMIRDTRSPYLNKDFMALSDECLRDGAKMASVDLKSMAKASRLHNDLVSESYWFHEKVMKVLSSAGLKPKDALPLSGVSEKFAKIEGLKFDLIDQIDLSLGEYRAARIRDEFMMSGAFGLFMLTLMFLAMKQAKALQALREIERQALALLNTGNANVAAMVDQLLGRALTAARMPVTLRVFRDYHGEVMENVGTHGGAIAPVEAEEVQVHMTHSMDEDPAGFAAPVTNQISTELSVAELAALTTEATATEERTNGLDVRKLLINQATRLNIPMEVQDGQVVAVNAGATEEAISQVLHAMNQRYNGWNARLYGHAEDGRYVIRLAADGVCLNSSELEYASRVGATHTGVDVNVVMAVDLAREEHLNFHTANRLGADGSIAGSEAIIELPLVPNRNLKNIVRGTKRDLEKQLRNLMN